MRTESYGNFRAHQLSAKTPRQDLGYENFSGMIMLEIGSEFNTNIGAYESLHPLTKNGIFLVYKQGNMNFMLITTVLSDSENLP
jgi:hypothetical protein